MPSSEWPDHGQNVRLSLSLLTPAREVERLREALEFVASCDFAVSADVQAIARKALADDPLIPAPKCETCGGNGRRGGYATDVSYCGTCHGTGAAEVTTATDQRDAWIRLFNRLEAAVSHHKRDAEANAENFTAEVIPVAVLREFIAEERADALDAYHPEDGMHDDRSLAEANALLDSLAALLDEHTRKEPTP